MDIRKIIKEELKKVFEDEHDDLKYMSDEWRQANIEARKETLLGKKIEGLADYEYNMHGFVFEDGTDLVVTGDEIEYRDSNNYENEKSQKAGIQYDFNWAYTKWKKHGEEPIFATKKEAKKFITLLNRFFPIREFDRKIKMKYLLTGDFKPKEMSIPTKEEFEKTFLGKVINLRDFDEEGKRIQSPYEISRVNYSYEEDMNLFIVFITFTKQGADFWETEIEMEYSVSFDEYGNKKKGETFKFGTDAGFGEDRKHYPRDINSEPEALAVYKQVKKMLTPKKSKDLDEIDLSVGHSMGPKPGIVRKFPAEDEGGHSLNLSVSDGPHQFPKEEDF